VNPLIRAIPPSLVRTFASRYVAGDSLAKAVDAAATLLAERSLLTTLDLLAEDIDSSETAARNAQTYVDMIDAVAERFTDAAARPTVSLKPSSYTASPLHTGGDAAGSREAMLRIASHARSRGVGVTVDMESRFWTDFTLAALNELHAAGCTNVGAVLQSRLFRTEQDLEQLPPGCRVRLVIGIYAEPSSVALTDKAAMKEKLLVLARRALERGHYVELGTHDEPYVRRFIDEVAPAAGAGPDRYEIQMLYGVPREALLSELRTRGVKARLYVPFALGWPMAIAYLRRRLDEYPAMMFLVAKNLFTSG
jgi:proline dehydrogenase